MSLRRIAIALVVLLGIAAPAVPAHADSLPATLVVTVTKPSGVPLYGVSLYGFGTGGMTGFDGTLTLTGTSSDSPVTITTGTIFGATGGVAPSTSATVTIAPGSNTAHLTLALHQLTGTIPVPNGAQLTATTASTPTFGVTNESVYASSIDGRFAFTDLIAPYIDEQPFYYVAQYGTGAVYSPGTPRLPDTTPIVAADSFAIPVTDRSGSITGRVVDARGNAVAGASVSLPHPPFTATTTDVTGAFVLAGVPGGFHTVWAQKAALFVSIPSVLVDGGPAALGAVSLAPLRNTGPTGTLTGVVSDKAGLVRDLYRDAGWKKGKKLKEPVLTITDQYGSDFTFTNTFATTPRAKDLSPSGTKKRVTATKLPAGKYTIAISGTAVKKTVVVKAGKTVNFGTLVAPEAEASVVITVLNSDGSRAAHQSVALSGASDRFGMTTKGGKLTERHVVAGKTAVTVVAGDVAVASKKITVPKKGTKRLTVSLPAPIVIRGTVTSPTGAPVAGLTVGVATSAASAECGPSASSLEASTWITDANGAFSWTLLTGTIPYYLTVCDTYANGYVSTQPTWRVVPSSGATVVQLGVR